MRRKSKNYEERKIIVLRSGGGSYSFGCRIRLNQLQMADMSKILLMISQLFGLIGFYKEIVACLHTYFLKHGETCFPFIHTMKAK